MGFNLIGRTIYAVALRRERKAIVNPESSDKLKIAATTQMFTSGVVMSACS